eukprot:2204510-Lingulodinium_polyedra.AAC.1
MVKSPGPPPMNSRAQEPRSLPAAPEPGVARALEHARVPAAVCSSGALGTPPEAPARPDVDHVALARAAARPPVRQLHARPPQCP